MDVMIVVLRTPWATQRESGDGVPYAAALIRPRRARLGSCPCTASSARPRWSSRAGASGCRCCSIPQGTTPSSHQPGLHKCRLPQGHRPARLGWDGMASGSLREMSGPASGGIINRATPAPPCSNKRRCPHLKRMLGSGSRPRLREGPPTLNEEGGRASKHEAEHDHCPFGEGRDCSRNRNRDNRCGRGVTT